MQNKDGREEIWGEVSSELDLGEGEEKGLEERGEEAVWGGNKGPWGHSEEKVQLQAPVLAVVTAE